MPLPGSLTDLLDPSRIAGRDACAEVNNRDAYNSEMFRAQTGENAWKNFFKRWPTLYDTLVFLIAPCFFTGLTPRRFIRTFVPTGIILNAGSGVRRLGDRCLNVDLFPFPGVDIVCDLQSLPFRDAVFDAVTCDQVLEHVADPEAVCRELLRVTKTGGLIHVASPFLFPWHPSPSDYTRWTQEGLLSLFPGCTVKAQGVLAGPCSALNAFLPAFLATILCFGSRTLQTVLQYVFLVLLFPLKFFDLLFAHLHGAELCAANFFLVVRKDS